MDQILNKVLNFVKTNNLISSNDRIVVGLSGGADSVCLLLLLNHLRSKLNFHLFSCHLNHKIRSQADDDMKFSAELSRQYNIPIYTDSIDVKKLYEENSGQSLEEFARSVRYDFYIRACKHFSANKIALAHHKDDQLETIIFNIIRGTNIHGLRGMPISRIIDPKSGIMLIRPLLCLYRNEIVDWLRKRKINWCEDHTNYELIASRNIIRNVIVPAFEKITPAFRENILSLAKWTSEVETIVDKQADKIFKTAILEENQVRIERWRLDTIPKIIATEVIRKMISHLTNSLGKITGKHLESLLTLSRKIDLPYKLTAYIENNWLVIGRKVQARKKRYKFIVERVDWPSEVIETFYRTKSRYEEIIDKDRVKGNLRIRQVVPGDKFCPLGLGGSKKVGDFLTDIKAPHTDRPGWVVVDDEKIVWLVGYRLDERVKVTERTQDILYIKVEELT